MKLIDYNGGANLPQNCVTVTFILRTDLERQTYPTFPMFCGQVLRLVMVHINATIV